MATRSSTLWTESAVICAKEIKSEFRTRYALGSMLLFGVTTVTAIGMATAQTGVDGRTQAALYWVVAFFSAMAAMSQVFVKEEETGTAMALKLAARPDAVYFGKFAFNLLILVFLQMVILPLFIMFVGLKVFDWTLFLSALALGTIGMAGAATIVGAIVAQANAKGALFTVLSFPLLLPILLGAIGATQAALDPVGAASAVSEIRLLIAYDVGIITASWMLFEFVWKT